MGMPKKKDSVVQVVPLVDGTGWVRYPLRIKNLKHLCSHLSRQHAVLLAEGRGITVDTEQSFISSEQHRKIAKYAAAAGFEIDDFDKQHIENYSLARIYKEAPILYKLINHLDKSFEVAMRHIECNGEPFYHLSTIFSSAKFPAIVKKASYFVTSEQIWTVDPDSKMLNSRGYNFGLSNEKENSVSYNLEFEIDLELLLHEVVHLKYVDWREKAIREAAALVEQDAPLLLKHAEGLKPKLDSEIKRIARDFARFDYKVGQILGINETPKMPQSDRQGLPLTLCIEGTHRHD